jgi:hypothetical protein
MGKYISNFLIDLIFQTNFYEVINTDDKKIKKFG